MNAIIDFSNPESIAAARAVFAQPTVAEPKIEIPQPNPNGEFQSPADGAIWMAATYGIPQTPLNGPYWEHIEEDKRGKVPFLPSWPETASTDPEQIRVWASKHPGCNFGSVFNGHAFAFEADSTAVRERFKSANPGKDFTSELIIVSRQGGHRYYLNDGSVQNISQSNLHGDFSVRASGEQCVSPGSVHQKTGQQYRVAKAGALTAPTPEEVSFWNSERVEKKSSVEVAQQAQIPSGQRNSALASTAGKLLDTGMAPERVKQEISEINEQRCTPPLSQKELAETIFHSIDTKWSKKEDAITRQVNNPTGKIDFPAQTVQVREIETESVNPCQTVTEGLDWLPVRVLASTRLQDIYQTDFEPYKWPLSLALPALVTAASVVVPPTPRQDGLVLGGDDSMTNLYTALIADVGAGKSQAIEWAAKAIGIHEPPVGQHYFEGKFGSAEQMLKSLHRKQSVFTTKSALINPDEWAHLFAKAAIPDASFPTVLTTAFYRRNQIVTVGGTGGGTEYALNLQMSFIGGIVEQEFDTVFGVGSLGGLYDRFLFGRAPDGFMWNYQPCHIEQKKHWVDWNMKPVRLDPSVYEVIKDGPKRIQISGAWPKFVSA